MCNLYTYRLAPWEVRNLLQHRELIGTNFPPESVYPNYEAPVIIEDAVERVAKTMRWGFPPPPNVGGSGKVTNVRNAASGYWKPWLKATTVKVGNDIGGRCVVPVNSFAEPDKNTSKPVVNRWFGRPDGSPFFFAGIWRTWTGDRGTKKAPNVGQHHLFSFLTTEPNDLVRLIHEKAMPVILTSSEEVEQWLTGTAGEALRLQRPADVGVLVVLPEEQAAAALKDN